MIKWDLLGKERFMDIFKNRNFVRLFFAALASQMGTTVGNMAFAFLLDRFSSQPSYTTLAELMYSLPTIFVFLIVGVVADRFDRKRWQKIVIGSEQA